MEKLVKQPNSDYDDKIVNPHWSIPAKSEAPAIIDVANWIF